MASGRMLRAQISLSETVNDLSMESALLFTWMIAHADDFGRMPGGARKVKAMVFPMRDDFPAARVDACLDEIVSAGLVQRYEITGELFIQFPSWETHQQGLHKRTKSKFPPPPSGNEKQDSGKFLEIPGNSSRARGTEQNGTEQEQKKALVPPADPPPTDTLPPAAPPAPADKPPRGTRLPDGWVLPKTWGDWALQDQPTWNAAKVRLEGEKFRDHWVANANQSHGKKSDWEAAWRNWVRKEGPVRLNGHAPPSGRPNPHILPQPGSHGESRKPANWNPPPEDPNDPVF